LKGRQPSDRGIRRDGVLIVSDKTAKAAWPKEDPLGRTISHWGHVYTVVGIAATLASSRRRSAAMALKTSVVVAARAILHRLAN